MSRLLPLLGASLLFVSVDGFSTCSSLMGRSMCKQNYPVSSNQQQLRINVDFSPLRMAGELIKEDPHDVFLAELIFSTSDVRIDIAQNIERCDEKFMSWLDNKIKNTTDLDERIGLKSLYETIEKVVEKMNEEASLGLISPDAAEAAAVAAQVAEAEAATAAPAAAAAATSGASKSSADVLRELKAMQGVMATGGGELPDSGATAATGGASAAHSTVAPAEMSRDVVLSYEKLIDEVVNKRPKELSLVDAVRNNYAKCDYQFMQLLLYKIDHSPDEDEVANCRAIEGCVNEIAAENMRAATEKFQTILKNSNGGEPQKLEVELVKLGQSKQLDEPFLLLVEANLLQAKQAPPSPQTQGAINVLQRILTRSRDILDQQQTPEKRLLRLLLRTESATARKKLLKDAFTPKEKLILLSPGGGLDGQDGGGENKSKPDVEPPAFIDTIKTMMVNFGNIELEEDGSVGRVELKAEVVEGKSEEEVAQDRSFVEKLRTLATEAEEVATAIYGKSLSAQEAQDLAWSKKSVSVFDLEAYEEQAEAQGDKMPWQNDDYDGILPDFGPDGKKLIGG